jgi:hypothetical protein
LNRIANQFSTEIRSFDMTVFTSCFSPVSSMSTAALVNGAHTTDVCGKAGSPYLRVQGIREK